MSTVSFNAFRLQEISGPLGVVTLLATTGERAKGSFVASLLLAKAKIAIKQQMHELKIRSLFFIPKCILVSTVSRIITVAKVGVMR